MNASLFKRWPESSYFKGLDPRIEASITVHHEGSKTTLFYLWDNGEVVRYEGPVSQAALAAAVEQAKIAGYKAWSH